MISHTAREYKMLIDKKVIIYYTADKHNMLLDLEVIIISYAAVNTQNVAWLKGHIFCTTGKYKM